MKPPESPPATAASAETGPTPRPGDFLKVTYQSFGQDRGMERYQRSLESLVTSSVGLQAQVTVLRLSSALLEGKGFSSAQALELPALLTSLTSAADAGAEAIAIGNGFDPGLWEARELLDVPILGLFETVAFYGLRLGWKLGVLCSGSSGPARVEELAARYGILSRLVQPVSLGIHVPAIMAAFDEPESAGELISATRDGVLELARRGAEVAMIASGALDVFVQVHGKGMATAIPVLPATRVLTRELEAAAALARAGVPAVSRAGRFRMPPKSVRSTVRKDL